MDARRDAFVKFKPKWFKDGQLAMIIGKKGTGKTTLLLDLCYRLRHCPEVTLFQKTLETNPAFHDIIPALFSYNSWRKDVIRTIIERQKKENKKRMREKRPPRYHTIIIDDLACDDSFCRDPILGELFMNARWLKINVLFTMQYSLKITPDLRNNIDWVFMLKEIMPNNRDRLFNHFCGQFGDKKYFGKVLERMTDNRGCMVMNNTGLSNKLTENFYYYKATPRNFNEDPSLPQWKMGSRAYWAFHYRHYNKHWDSSTDDDSDQMIIVQK